MFILGLLLCGLWCTCFPWFIFIHSFMIHFIQLKHLLSFMLLAVTISKLSFNWSYQTGGVIFLYCIRILQSQGKVICSIVSAKENNAIPPFPSNISADCSKVSFYNWAQWSIFLRACPDTKNFTLEQKIIENSILTKISFRNFNTIFFRYPHLAFETRKIDQKWPNHSENEILL